MVLVLLPTLSKKLTNNVMWTALGGGIRVECLMGSNLAWALYVSGLSALRLSF